MKKEIVFGVAGAGMGAELEVSALLHVCGVPFRLKSVMGRRPEQVEPFQKKYGFEKCVYDYNDLLNDEEIDVIAICTPPYAHEEQIIRALRAGKHVICEKPFVGYFGEEGDETPVGTKVSKRKMYESLLEKMALIRQVEKESGKRFMYADNAVYAPAVQKAAQVIRAKKSKILYAKGEESLKGSTSPVANFWDKTGGGTFIRNGTHPLSAILWLKQQEAEARGESIALQSVVADMGMVTPSLTDYEHRHIDTRPLDVEDSGTAVLTFTDGSKALILATNTYLGGLLDYVELYCNDATLKCNLTQHDAMQGYFLDEDGIEQMKLSYLLPSKTGWNNIQICDDMIRGYIGEMQDFMEAIAYDRAPMSGIDLAKDTMKVIYAAYLSAEQGGRVTFNE